MTEILLFVEDDAQEKFIRTLVARMAEEAGVPLSLRVRATQGGVGRVLKELEYFEQSCARGEERLPEALVVAVDANCRGLNDRRKQVDQKTSFVKDRIVHAIADPHIERWLLLDGSAFKKVLGQGCRVPDQKCEKDRYKRLLAEAVIAAGLKPLLGGIEYAESLADCVNIRQMCRLDPGFRLFVKELRAILNRSQQSEE